MLTSKCTAESSNSTDVGQLGLEASAGKDDDTPLWKWLAGIEASIIRQFLLCSLEEQTEPLQL